MSTRFFLDTNVFVYSFDTAARAKARKAQELINEALTSRKGVISYQVVQEFFNVAFRRFAKPMNPAEAQRYMGTVFRSILMIHSSEALYTTAIRITNEHRISWYDSLIVAAALEGECAVLYSEDLQHGRTLEGLEIQNPFV